MGQFREVTSGRRVVQKLYITIMLWFVGRAIVAAYKSDPEVRREFDTLPGGFTFSLGVLPVGPRMVIRKEQDGKVRYLGQGKGEVMDLDLTIKHMQAFFMILSFQESTSTANARARLYVDGGVPEACAVVRVLDVVQVHLLPKFIAKLAVKRYPAWSWTRHILVRSKVYLRTVTGI
ncbi:hypothetical protein [Desulfoluna sp.]|uniref:hypothetical protein n=1 Tax=Desulfoluna sp. TaxID=2045199 RepID=UPI002616805D|nr:hypothetical protein [Desulfoluna sp.]